MSNIMPRTFINLQSDKTRNGLKVTATSADHISVNAGWSNNGTESEPVRYGKDNALECRFVGHFYKQADGTYALKDEYRPSFEFQGHGDTERRRAQVIAVVTAEVTEWANANHGAIAHADTISRNNAASTIEKQIEEHRAALAILTAELEKIETGQDFTSYPKLPTARR